MRENISVAIFGISLLAGCIIHFWTTIIAFAESGVAAAIISFMLPAISEIYWAFMMWNEIESYSYSVLGLIIGLPLTSTIAGLLAEQK